MKTLVFLLLQTSLLISCAGKESNKQVINNEDTIMDTSEKRKPIRTDERIDIEQFKQEIQKYGNTQKLEDGTIVKKYFSNHPKDPLFYESKDYINGYYSYEEYHLNGVLRSSRQDFRNAPFGNYLEYDSLGYLVKQIDYDKGYISIEQMVEKFKEQTEINLYDLESVGKPMQDISVLKDSVSNKPYFQIVILTEMTPYSKLTPREAIYFLDGATGQVVYKKITTPQVSNRREYPSPDDEIIKKPTPKELFEQYLDSIKNGGVSQKQVRAFNSSDSVILDSDETKPKRSWIDRLFG